ncbi:hypothetical protein HQ590_15165 [bacterium]|nr:hypothetical protein [bacterium]
MSMFRRILTVAAVGCAVLLLQQAAIAKKGGTSILHYMVKAVVSGTDGASADLDLQLKQQGKADKTRLILELSGLESNTTYDLVVITAGDITNVVESFTTDADGNQDFIYVHVGSSKGKGNGGSPGGDPVPAELKPLVDVLALEVVDVNTQAVVSVDLWQDAGKIQYLVKRPLDNDGVENKAVAWLRLKANQNQQQLRIKATGLTAGATYHLALNDTIAADYVADDKGRLKIKGLPGGAPNLLDLMSLAIKNSDTNSVLSTELP